MKLNHKKVDNGNSKKLKVFFVSAVILILEGVLLKFVGFSNSDPLEIWGASLVYASAMELLFYIPLSILRNTYKTIANFFIALSTGSILILFKGL